MNPSNMTQSDEVHRIGEEEFNNIFGGEDEEGIISSDENKRKRYHRHTQRQIEAMEAFFRECPHPDTKQRIEISQALGMEPLQVKFWFQNKRTQKKAKQERTENLHLRALNEKLKAENMRYREALGNACCPACGVMPVNVGVGDGDVTLDERHLRMENTRLREEIDRISAQAAKYVGKPIANSTVTQSSSIPRPTDLSAGPSFRRSTSNGNEGFGTQGFAKSENNEE